MACDGEDEGVNFSSAGVFQGFCTFVECCTGSFNIINQANRFTCELMSLSYCECVGDILYSLSVRIHICLRSGVSDSDKVGIEFSAVAAELFGDKEGLVVSSGKAFLPVKGDGDKIIDVVAEWAVVQGGFSDSSEDWSKFAVGVFEDKYHIS